MKTADFETTTKPEDCRVWAWGICDIDSLHFTRGKSIDSFINYVLSKGKSEVYYFHNLKFDGQFILSYLLTKGWVLVREGQLTKRKQFKTLISDKGVFYSITLCNINSKGKPYTIQFLDSLKLLPFSVAKIAKDFNLPILKGTIDYEKERCVGYELDENEISYLRNDVEIMARALKIFFSTSMGKMTIGSNALAFYKKMKGTDYFNRRFPTT